MFEGRFSLAVVPAGGAVLPPAVRKEMHKRWGAKPELLCFGVQFLYICQAKQAERLLRHLDAQLCAAAPEKRDVTAYFQRMERSVARLQPDNNGAFILPQHLMELCGVPEGGVLTLLGVVDHLELWNRPHLERQSKVLEGLTHSSKDAPAALTETPLCLSEGYCSLARGGKPDPRRCGPCVFLRLP